MWKPNSESCNYLGTLMAVCVITKNISADATACLWYLQQDNLYR